MTGGSANAYEYAGGDPINNFDLTGEKCVGKWDWIARCKRLKEEAYLRRSNKKGVMTFRMRRNALQKFLNKPSLIDTMRKDAKEWTLQQQRLARSIANDTSPYGGVDCSEIGRALTYTGAAGFFTAFIPGFGQVGVIIGGVTSLGGAAAQLGADSGVC